MISLGLYAKYKKIDPEDLIINFRRIVIVEKEEKVNYLTMENHDIKNSMNKEKFEKLKQYMKDNNLRIKSGRYEMQDADTFKRLIRWRLKFEPDI